MLCRSEHQFRDIAGMHAANGELAICLLLLFCRLALYTSFATAQHLCGTFLKARVHQVVAYCPGLCLTADRVPV